MYRLLASVVCAGGGGRTATHRNVSVHITGTRLVNCTACLFVWVDSEGVQLKPESCPCPVNSWGLRYEGKHVPDQATLLIRKGSKQGVQIPSVFGVTKWRMANQKQPPRFQSHPPQAKVSAPLHTLFMAGLLYWGSTNNAIRIAFLAVC